MKKLFFSCLVMAIVLSACSMTWGVKDNPFVGSWIWNGAPWSFTSAMTFIGPSSSGAYSFAITKDAPYHGVGTIGTITIAGEPQTYDFLIEDSLHIGLSHTVLNPPNPPATTYYGVLIQ